MVLVLCGDGNFCSSLNPTFLLICSLNSECPGFLSWHACPFSGCPFYACLPFLHLIQLIAPYVTYLYWVPLQFLWLELCMASLSTKFLCISVFILFFYQGDKSNPQLQSFTNVLFNVWRFLFPPFIIHLCFYSLVSVVQSFILKEVANVCIITRMCSLLLGALKMCTNLWGKLCGATCFISYVVLRIVLTMKKKKKKSTTDPAKCFCLTVGLSPSEHVSPPFPAILVLLRCLPEQNNPSSHCIFERENAT